ncbi:MAG: ArnT family glycosyltransferase [Roseiflexaceae bacterium]
MTTHTTRIQFIVLFSLLTVLFVNSSMLALRSPLGEAPDEPAHMDYARFVAVNQRLPVQCANPCRSDVPGEGHQPPLAYLIAAAVTYPWIDHGEWVPQPVNPGFVWSDGTDRQALIHGTRELWPWQGNILAWRIMRMLSAVLITVAVGVVWLIAQRISTPNIALTAVALLVITPQTAIVGSTMSNDALLMLFSSVAIYQSVIVTRRRGMILLGLWLGCAIITKLSAIVLLPLILWSSWKALNGHARWQGFTLACTIIIATSGWWFWRNYGLYGDILGYELFQQTYATGAINIVELNTWQQFVQQLIRSTWGVYGWMSLSMPDWWYVIGGTITIICGFGIGLRLSRMSRPTAIWWLFMMLIVGAYIWLISLGMTVGAVAWQSRLIIMIWPIASIIMAAGLIRGLGAKLHPIILLGIAIIGSSTSMFIWAAQIAPSYRFDMPAWSTTETPLTVMHNEMFVEKTSGGGILLLDSDVSPAPAPGQTVTVRLRWQVVSRPAQAWEVFVVVRNPQKEWFVDMRDRMHPTIPSTVFTPGDRFISTHQVSIPTSLPSNEYIMQVGLVDTATQQRAVKRNDAGKILGDSINVSFRVGTPAP